MAAGIESGLLIAGRYRLGRELGRGGMAIVYHAHDEQLDRAVAVKLLRVESEAPDNFGSTLIREARAAAQLPHPNIITVFDAGQHDGSPFVVMEEVRGGELRALLRVRGRLPPPEAARLAIGIARGLAAVHARGLVHCDVKPQNILLSEDGSPKLIDFGIALGATTGTLPRDEIIGSAPYLSPEQVTGARIDARTDVYALGIVLYELLAGAPPFTGATAAEIAARRLNSPPPGVREQAPDTPQGLAAVIERALALEPARRFPEASAFAEALTPYAARGSDPHAATTKVLPVVRRPRGSASAPPPSVPRRSLPAGPELRVLPAWPQRWLLAGLAALVVLVAAGVGVAVFGSPGAGSAGMVDVPSVAGSRYEDAEKALRAAGLEPRRGDEPVTLDTPRGVVVTQEPLGGQRARSGSSVTLMVSRGIELPRLVGRQWDEVKPWLDQHGWTLGRVRFVFADQADFGKVVAQEPGPDGGPVDDRTNVAISVNVAGPPEATRTGFPAPSAPQRAAPPPPPTAPAPTVNSRPSKPAGKPDRQKRED